MNQEVFADVAVAIVCIGLLALIAYMIYEPVYDCSSVDSSKYLEFSKTCESTYAKNYCAKLYLQVNCKPK